MMEPLTTIANRKTPSVPMQITFGSQIVATGRKFATLFGHMAASVGSGMPYQVYQIINVGDPAAAKAEVDALAGTGSQLGKMTAAFINANLLAGNSNFPAFRVVLLPNAELHFGPNGEALAAVAALRSDLLVSCYPSGDSPNRMTLEDFAISISGADRDLSGQFGSFQIVGSIDSLAVQVAYAINSFYTIVSGMPDSNTASIVGVTGTVTALSPVINALARAPLTPNATFLASSLIITLSTVANVYVGAMITGAGIQAGTIIESISGLSVTISLPTSAPGVAEPVSIQNLLTAGIYKGALLTGAGIPAGTVVQSFDGVSITMTNAATLTGVSEAIGIQNQISQPPEILAAAQAAILLSLAFPYVPVQGMTVGGLIPAQILSDRIIIDPNGSSEAMLQAGISPFYVQAGGTVGLIRSVTTFTLKSDNVTPITAYFDWQDIVILYDYREDMFAVFQNPPFNNNPGGTKDTVVIAGFAKDELLRVAGDYEIQGAFQGVKALAPLFKVVPSQTSRGRIDFKVPSNVVSGLFVIAGNIQGVSGINFGDFKQ